MVVSTNNQANADEFNKLLSSLQTVLNEESKKNSRKYIDLAGKKLEGEVCGLLNELAINTPFDKSIKLVSGQKFPDIIAKKFYGIEVKTTISNHWKTTGNSVLEGTRVKNVERIYLLFGKLFEPVEFKIKPYEDCLAEVVVTHSPRYLIDMNLNPGETIFDKLKIDYNDLRGLRNPIKPITDYYKAHLKPGESLWWMDNANSVNVKIRVWSSLSLNEKAHLKAEAMVFFPEIFGGSPTKFTALTFWLLNAHGIINSNLRDSFTAGGKTNIEYGDHKILKAPKVIYNLISLLPAIKNIIHNTPSDFLKTHWGFISERGKYEDWKKLVIDNFNKANPSNQYNIPLDRIL